MQSIYVNECCSVGTFFHEFFSKPASFLRGQHKKPRESVSQEGPPSFPAKYRTWGSEQFGGYGPHWQPMDQWQPTSQVDVFKHRS